MMTVVLHRHDVVSYDGYDIENVLLALVMLSRLTPSRSFYRPLPLDPSLLNPSLLNPLSLNSSPLNSSPLDTASFLPKM